ncbi:MAG TPA: haloalkane dehalogenase [Acidimicrobiia bacterium]|nr:haloalkane dehalogenase [Acidimicrobiia bacterium]
MTDKQYCDVHGARMAYVERGAGAPIVFLHGNPTSSYLWRDVIGELEGIGRCIAPDLIGMGDSDKVGGDYRFVDHRPYLDGLLDALGVESDVTFVVHDWGGGLGFDWANRHRDAVRALVYMETIVMPVEWSDWPDSARGIFEAMRSEAGETIVLDKNVFVERILPASVLAPLSAETLAEYRRPFLEQGEGRRPTLSWPRQIPIDGHPADVAAIVADYAEWLAGSDVPKLFINAEPGSILVGRQRDFCRTWPNQQEVTVAGSHFIQEDSGPEIGRAAAAFLRSLG